MLGNISGIMNSLNAQQTKLDVAANNIANINSTAYKKNTVSFSDVYYETVFAPGMPATDKVRCGGGAIVSGTDKNFSPGLLVGTGRYLDMAVDGEGFFGVTLPDGTRAYTRQGNFQLDGELGLTASGGRVYADMVLPKDFISFSVSDTGEIKAQLPDGQWETAGRIPLFIVPNPAGMEAMGTGMYRETPSSGPVSEATAGSTGIGKIKQGYLEQTNVNLAEEMVNVIVAQRSFQFSCQALRTLDDMWGLANNLQR